jgi:hypothetical protein
MLRSLIIFFCLFSLNSYAFDLNKALDALDASTDESGKISIKAPSGVGKGLTKGLEGNIKKEVDKVLKKYEKQLNDKVKKIEDKINKEIDSSLGDVKGLINEAKSIRAKAYNLIKLAKIAMAVISFSFLAGLFFIWRAFKRIKGLYKILENVKSYKDIEKRVAGLEKAKK